MKKRLLSLVLALAICLGLTAVPALAADNDFVIRGGVLTDYTGLAGDMPIPNGVTQVVAKAGNINLSLNGIAVKLGTYNIANSNYVKLRDVAQLLNGTEKQFSVTWDGVYSQISLTRGAPYISTGGELASLAVGEQLAAPSSAGVDVDGAYANMTAYTIHGNNFFRLRDLGIALDFYVGWDSGTGIVTVDTTKGYTGGSSDGISDQDLLVQARMFLGDMQGMYDKFYAGELLPFDYNNVIYVEPKDIGGGVYIPNIVEYDGRNNHYYQVIGCTGVEDLEASLRSAWYRRFAHKYPFPVSLEEMYFHKGPYGNAEGVYLEYNGAIYTAQLSDYGGFDDPFAWTVDKLALRTSDEAIFHGHSNESEWDGFRVDFELSLVYEDGIWKYGYCQYW